MSKKRDKNILFKARPWGLAWLTHEFRITKNSVQHMHMHEFEEFFISPVKGLQVQIRRGSILGGHLRKRLGDRGEVILKSGDQKLVLKGVPRASEFADILRYCFAARSAQLQNAEQRKHTREGRYGVYHRGRRQRACECEA